MTFGEQNSLPQSFQLLDKAFDAGINFFDSAEMYVIISEVPNYSLCVSLPSYIWISVTILYEGSGIQCHSVRKLKGRARSILDVGLEREIFLGTVSSSPLR